MSDPVLHYIHDPLCGWCYGVAPLVRAAREVLTLRAHGGGMMAGARRRKAGAELRAFVMPHDRRIARTTGQPFGEAYFDGLLCDETAVLDSEPPIAAVLAAESLAQRGLDLLARLQQAHYVEGRRIAEQDVLIEMAARIGLDRTAFAAGLAQTLGATARAHIAQTRALMSHLGVQGFPAMALELDGGFAVVDVGAHLSNPASLTAWLRTRLPAIETAVEDFGCGIDACLVPGEAARG